MGAYQQLRRFAAWIGTPALVALMLGPADWVTGIARELVDWSQQFSTHAFALVTQAAEGLQALTGLAISAPYRPLIVVDVLLALVLADGFAEFGLRSYWSHVVRKVPPLHIAVRVFVLWVACIVVFLFLARAAAGGAGMSISQWATQLTAIPSTALDVVVLLTTVGLAAAILFWHPGVSWRLLVVYAFVQILAQLPDLDKVIGQKDQPIAAQEECAPIPSGPLKPAL